MYLERTHASVETVNRAAAVRTLAERQMGEFLKQMPKATGELKRGPAVPERNHGEQPPTLADIGITKKQSSTAQKLASLPEGGGPHPQGPTNRRKRSGRPTSGGGGRRRPGRDAPSTPSPRAGRWSAGEASRSCAC